MHLQVTQRIDQGTKKGAMKFRPGQTYPIEPHGDEFLITHEPVIRMVRVEEDGKTVRKPAMVTQTVVPAAVLEKLKAVAKVEG